MPVVLGDLRLLSRFGVYDMLKRIIDAFYDIVDYGFFSAVRKKNNYRSPQFVSEALEKDVQQNKDGEPLSDSFFVRHIIDIIGIVLTMILFFSEKLATLIYFLLLWGFLLLLTGYFMIIPMILAMNIAAYIMVKRNNEVGIIPAFFGGIIGGALSVYLENREYIGKAFIKVLFKIFIWICIMAVFSVWLFHVGYYDFSLF